MCMRCWLWIACLPAAAVQAAPWSFGDALTVARQPADAQAPVFHHLDASGRRNIAVSPRGVAIAWEDDRDGTPRIYLAYKPMAADRFVDEVRVSGEGEAYEPSLVALDEDRFALAWEEADQVWMRLLRIGTTAPTLGPLYRLSLQRGAQASLSADGDALVAVWSERPQRFGRIRASRLLPQALKLRVGEGCPVDAVPPSDEQLYPAAAVLQGRLVVAWEDRRPKHTIIMAAIETQPGTCRFSAPARISDKRSSRNLPYGAGHGVSRVALRSVGDRTVFAAWADKRNFRNGYDIWGAFYRLGETGFGRNERVQDDFGGLSKQRHASVAGNVHGLLAVAWDDEREGNTDIMLSWREADGWSDDWPLPDASGPGWQSSPGIVLDDAGNLHAAWIERDRAGGATRLKYAFGRYSPE